MSIPRIPGPSPREGDDEQHSQDTQHGAAEQHQVEEYHSAKEYRRAHEQPAGEGPRPRAKPGSIPTEQDCLRMLAALNTLLLMGFIDPRRATAMRSTLAEILRYYRGQQASRTSPSTLSESDLATLLAADPKLVDLFAPLLSDEQVDWLLRRGAETQAHE
jgi:hypothetical protein